MLYRIFWKVPRTGKIEHGISLFEKEQAQEIADFMNNRWGTSGFTHWIEPVPDDDKSVAS